MDGLIIIDKPRGPSSFDVVRSVRRVAKIKRVGHTGTLDPDASGVLGVAIGKCTKLAQFLSLERKEYEFEVVFGTRTDSDDAMGKVVATAPTDMVTVASIEAAIPDFVGSIQQVPPNFSAIHVDGKRAYELARAGVEFELAARTVYVYELELLAFDVETSMASMRVRCGSGTYVRSIARDLAEKLGTVAHARGIRRTAVGPFTVDRSVPLDELSPQTLEQHLLTPAQMVAGLPGVRLESRRCTAIGMGQRVVVTGAEFDDFAGLEIGEPVAVLGENGDLVAVTIVEALTESDALLKPKRVLQPKDGPGPRTEGGG